MKRIKLTVAYDGTNYSGWQIQSNACTIEAVLDKAIEQVTGEKVHVIGASRTDAGVHAMGNVAVFDTASSIPGERWAYAINRYMPEDVTVMESREVSSEFHPRHCNTEKTYEYTILNTEFSVPQLRNFSWHVQGDLNLYAMRQAAGYLVGEHDFKSFCCVKTQAESTVRTVYSIEVEIKNGIGSETQSTEASAAEAYEAAYPASARCKLVKIRITGNGFLYNMVRIIAGTLVQVGKGRISPEKISEMLEICDRTAAGQTAPPQGLMLLNINYVDNDDKIFSIC